ncbi:MAG: hypothetical protein RBG13Loki_0730 [Promethearchaeota archaeon CR_4]|nr:MAG: hypothetical protein RBG13Loki_0730 [Candidatus Lokiarchaeota archaeon CR_4]
MQSKLKMLSRRNSSAYREKLNRFKDVDTDVLITLYKDIEHSYNDINQALKRASVEQTFYFAADAKSCKTTLTEIKKTLRARGDKREVNGGVFTK